MIHLNDINPCYDDDIVFILSYGGVDYRHMSNEERLSIGALEEYLSFKAGKRIQIEYSDVRVTTAK